MPRSSVNKAEVYENMKEWGNFVSTAVVISVNGPWPRSTDSRVENVLDFIAGSVTVLLFTLSLG